MQSAVEGSSSGASISRLALAVLRTPLVLLQLASKAPSQPSLLPTLPLPLLENICQHLSRADLWALLRCCKELWQQMQDHPLIWGDLYVRLDGGPTTTTILTVLFSKQRALGKLHVAVTQPTAFLPLNLLSCSWLTELTLSKAKLMGTLTQLPLLPNARRLALIDCSLSAGFAQSLIGKLPALADLEVLRATFSWPGPLRAPFASFDLLKGLTRLRLGSCSLRTVPWQLTGLSALVELHLDGNDGLGGPGGRGHWSLKRLSHLSCLTLLSLASCSLQMVPRELSSLASLQSLDIRGNVFRDAGHALQCLQHLTNLTSLNLACCQSTALPRYLSTLPSLSHLDLSYNPFQGRPSAELEPNLYGFEALTFLGLRGCRLMQLHPSIATTCLTNLTKLDLGKHA